MNILLSSVGRRDYLVEYFKSVLNGIGKVIATNSNRISTGMLAADVSLLVPNAWSANYDEILLSICREHKIRMLISLHDWEVPYIALSRQKFIHEGVIPVVPHFNIVGKCLDKYKTIEIAQSVNVYSPKTYISLDKVYCELDSGALNYPLVIKPRLGHGSLDQIIVNNNQELNCGYIMIQKKNPAIELLELFNIKLKDHVIIQEMIVGQEYGIDIINDLNGNYVTSFVKKKVAMRSGETDGAVTVNDDRLHIVAEKIANVTRHPGLMDTDFFISEDGDISLLELNPRFGGGYPFSHIAGANIPSVLVAWAMKDKVNYEELKIVIGVQALKGIRMVKVSNGY